MTTVNREDILKAVQAMSGEERLKLLADIASLPDAVDEPVRQPINFPGSISDQEVKQVTAQFIGDHETLLRRLAQ
jgi:hypothetical protein